MVSDAGCHFVQVGLAEFMSELGALASFRRLDRLTVFHPFPEVRLRVLDSGSRPIAEDRIRVLDNRVDLAEIQPCLSSLA